MKKLLLAIIFCFSFILLIAGGIDEIYELSCDLDAETGHYVMDAVTNIGNVQVQGLDDIKIFTDEEIEELKNMRMIAWTATDYTSLVVCSGRGYDCWTYINRAIELHKHFKEMMDEFNNL